LIATKTVGVFGGTFDPIHYGHIHLIKEIIALDLFDQIVVLPAGNPWQKKPQVEAKNRFDMVKLALQDLPVLVSDIELNRTGASYAIDSVIELKRSLGPCEISWIAGSDVIESLGSWHNIEKLANEVEFLFITRPKVLINQQKLPHFVKHREIEISALDISATQVRMALASKSDVSGLIPDNVAKFIEEKGLYAGA